MERLGHLDPSLLLIFYLKQWNKLWSGFLREHADNFGKIS